MSGSQSEALGGTPSLKFRVGWANPKGPRLRNKAVKGIKSETMRGVRLWQWFLPDGLTDMVLNILSKHWIQNGPHDCFMTCGGRALERD